VPGLAFIGTGVLLCTMIGAVLAATFRLGLSPGAGRRPPVFRRVTAHGPRGRPPGRFSETPVAMSTIHDIPASLLPD